MSEKLHWMCELDEPCERRKEGTTNGCAFHNAAARKEKRMDSQPTVSARPLKRMPVKKVSDKQADINAELRATYEFLDNMVSQQDGMNIKCKAYPNLYSESNSIIDHSHTISRDRCKKLGKPELIYDPANIEHCSRVAHEEWDNYSPKMLKHANWQKRMDFIKLHDHHDYERRMEIWALHNPAKATI